MKIEEVTSKFELIESSLLKKAWFKKDHWQSSVHPFPKKNPTGVTFHIFKKHWFNEEGKGIHIESHLDLDSKKQKKTYLTIHLLHEDIITGTKLKRMALSKPIIDEVFETISDWDGYKFRAGKYGQQPFIFFIDATQPKFEKDLEVEITKLCKLFGPLIDNKILDLSKK